MPSSLYPFYRLKVSSPHKHSSFTSHLNSSRAGNSLQSVLVCLFAPEIREAVHRPLKRSSWLCLSPGNQPKTTCIISYLFTGVNLVWSLLLTDSSLITGTVSYSSAESQYTWFLVHSNCSIHPERIAGLISPIYTFRMSSPSCSFLPSSLTPFSSFTSENSQLWSNSVFFHKPPLVSPTNRQTGHPSFHFCPKPRFFPHSQCYSRFHFRKSTRTNLSLLPNAATFVL